MNLLEFFDDLEKSGWSYQEQETKRLQAQFRKHQKILHKMHKRHKAGCCLAEIMAEGCVKRMQSCFAKIKQLNIKEQ